jgi:signal transduction protein with GAF and PtsI domain
VLNIECCWIQTISDRKKQTLSLAADRGFNEKMRSEIAAMDLTYDFCGQIIGMGNKITIPDLNNDGAYGLASFRTAGYKWLVAVPLMTYRAWGLLGTASKNKKILEKDTADLIMVIAGLIANALSKSHLAGSFIRRNQLAELTAAQAKKEMPRPDTNTEIAPVTSTIKVKPQNIPVIPPVNLPPAEETEVIIVEKKPPVEKIPPKHIDPVFHSHTRKMQTFRKTHR